MATSGSTDFAQTATSLVEDARRKLGIQADEEPLQAHELQNGLRALNRMLKLWQAQGVGISFDTEGTLTLVQGDVDYVFGSGGDFTTVPFEISQMRITRNGSEIPMIEISREDYFSLPNKTTQGYPTQWFYDRQRNGGTLYVWPAPDVTAGTLGFTYRRVIEDMDEAGNDLDLPQEWYDAVVYNLAVRMMPEYGGAGTPEAQLVIAEAARSFDVVAGFSNAHGEASIMITPFQG